MIPLFLGSQKLISPNRAEKLFQNRMPQPDKSDEDNIFVLGVCFGHRETSDETCGIPCAVGNESWNQNAKTRNLEIFLRQTTINPSYFPKLDGIVKPEPSRESG